MENKGHQDIGLNVDLDNTGQRGSNIDNQTINMDESAYKDLFENAVMGIYQSTPDGRFLNVNSAFVHMLGYSSKEELLEGIRDIARQFYVNPEDRERFKQSLAEKNELRDFEVEVRCKGGGTIWIVSNTRAVRDIKGNIIYYEGTVQDITERKRAQDELKKVHRQLFDIIDNLPDATFVIDEHRRVIAWNKAIEDMTGVKKKDIIGQGDYAYSIPFYGKRRPILIDLLFITDVEIEKKYDFVHKRGNTYYVEVFVPGVYRGKGGYLWAAASRLFDEEGRVIGAMESIRDITEWKRAEAQLKASEEKYRGIFDNAVEGIFQTSPEGRFISVNPALAAMMGFDSPEEMIEKFTDIGRQHYVIPGERERYRRLLAENGFVKGFEVQVYRKDSKKIWISVSSRAIYDAAGRLDHYEGTVIDITKRKEAEEDLKKAYGTIRDIIEGTPTGIYVVNEDGYMEYANPAFAEISGIELDKIKSINVLELSTYKEAGLSDKIKSALEGQSFSIGPMEYTSYHSRKKTIRRYTGIPIEEAGKRKAVIFIEDLTELKEAEKQLKKERETFFSILENSMNGVILVGQDGRFSYVNPEFTNITGYTIDDVPDGRHWFHKAFPDPEYRRHIIGEWKKDRTRGKRGANLQFHVVCKDKSVKEIEFKSTHLEDGSSVTILSDITELKHAERALRESEERFRSLFEGSRDAIYFTKGNGNLIDGNQAFIEMFGYKREEIKLLNARVAYADGEEIERLKKVLKRNDFVKDFDIRLKKKDGSIMDCLLTVSCRRDEKGKVYEYQGIVRDITERKKTEEAVRYMAFHDMLTGLPNRSLFNDRLNVALAHGERFEKMVAVMMLDLDRFKEVNDTYGHTTGDRLLKAVADRLISQIRKGDTVARMGGDEFMLIFTDLKDREDARAIAEKIVDEFKPPIHFNGITLYITISLGVALFPYDGQDIDTLVKNADIAMYGVKYSGRNGYRFYEQDQRLKGDRPEAFN
ncbi:MAG TPA: PAS domain S-box protein [Syntrophorhabdaceae bacterium]|nr:PAS domain S-box protein [Syntrophorhabdaceae bacterium]